MTVPGFNAETSLYKSSNHYRLAASGNFLGDGNAFVVPQGCGRIKTGVCAVGVLGAGTLCAAVCIESSGAFCAACIAIVLPGSLYGFCRDCLPGWIRAILDAFDSSGGGGVELPCCPPGTVCKCGGHCELGQCTGPCLPPGAACPPTPPPPTVCEPGEKCCEHDEHGNCTECIPHNWKCPPPIPR